MKQISIFIFFLILTQACTRSHTKDVPKDFGFRIETETAIINSFDSSYTIHYLDSNSVVKLFFSNEEMSNIYNIFIENRLNDLPTILKPKCEILMMPIFTKRFDFRINGKYFQTEYNNSCKDNFLRFLTRNRIKRLDATIKYIRSIVETKSEIKNMAPTDLVFK